MKIAIDLTQIPNQLTGVGFYMENLIKELAQIDNENEYYLFLKKDALPIFRVANKRFKYITISKYPYFIRVLWEQLILPFYLFFMGIKLLHSPHYTTPLLGWWFKRIVTFPDMTFFLFPNLHIRWKVSYFQRMMKISAALADKIVSISYATTKDIQKILFVSQNKIATTQLAVSDGYRPDIDKHKVKITKDKYGLPAEYILYVGTIEPRKNLPNLVRAYQLMSQQIKDRYKLVIAGKKGWHYNELFDVIKSSSDSNNVIFSGYVEEEYLPDIYNGAALFVYPSFYEGFGIPVLESLACGIPTITSNISSMPEVIEGAGILIDPNNPLEICQAMEKALTDKDLANKMKISGLEQAEKFSWQRCAKETLIVYEEVFFGSI